MTLTVPFCMVPSFRWGWDHAITLATKNQMATLASPVSRTHLVPKELVVQVLGIGLSGELASNTDDSEWYFSGHFWLWVRSRRVGDCR